MDTVPMLLALLATVILVGALGETVTKKTQIPDVIWLILLGIILGPVTDVIPREALRDSAKGVELFASITLIIVLFEGGSRLKLGELARAAPRATVLSLTGFVVTVFSVAVISWLAGAIFADGWTFTHGVMLGAIVGGSSSLIVMPSMNLAKLDEKVSNLVGLESALTDALCVVVTLAMISILDPSVEATGSPLATLGKQFGIAILVGSVAAWCWMPVMRLLRGSPHAYPVTLSALIVLYVGVEKLGGSAALGILAFAIVVGNARSIVAKVGFLSDAPVDLGDSVRDVHSNIAFIVKSLFFCFIGLMIGPPWEMVAGGILLGLLQLVVRVPAVWLVTRNAGFSLRDQKIITVSLPRGMAAGVLATIPAAKSIPATAELGTLVFATVVTTILVFAIGFPLSSRDAEPTSEEPQEPQPEPQEPQPESGQPFAARPVGVLTEPLIEVAELIEGRDVEPEVAELTEPAPAAEAVVDAAEGEGAPPDDIEAPPSIASVPTETPPQEALEAPEASEGPSGATPEEPEVDPDSREV